MANIKISQLPYVSTSGLTSDDVFPIVNYDTLLGTTKHTKLSDIQDFVLSGVTFGSTFTGGTVTGNTTFTNGLVSNVFQMTSGATNGYVLTSDSSGNATWQQSQDVTTLGTGLTIHFSAKTIFNLPSSPATGNVSGDTTNAKLGLIQKLYHSGSTEPTFPITWKLVGEGVYFTNELNIIYAEYIESNWIEYWIIQQQ